MKLPKVRLTIDKLPVSCACRELLKQHLTAAGFAQSYADFKVWFYIPVRENASWEAVADLFPSVRFELRATDCHAVRVEK